MLNTYGKDSFQYQKALKKRNKALEKMWDNSKKQLSSEYNALKVCEVV
jgi:recombinational DNA repair ATPase RecF